MQKFERPQAGGGRLRPELNVKALRRRNALYGRPDDTIKQFLPALERSLGVLNGR